MSKLKGSTAVLSMQAHYGQPLMNGVSTRMLTPVAVQPIVYQPMQVMPVATMNGNTAMNPALGALVQQLLAQANQQLPVTAQPQYQVVQSNQVFAPFSPGTRSPVKPQQPKMANQYGRPVFTCPGVKIVGDDDETELSTQTNTKSSKASSKIGTKRSRTSFDYGGFVPVKVDGLSSSTLGVRIGQDSTDLSEISVDVDSIPDFNLKEHGQTAETLLARRRVMQNLVINKLRKRAAEDCGIDYEAMNQQPHKKHKNGFSCGSCGKVCASQQELRLHAQGHIGEKRRICLICGKGFDYPSDLRKHRRIHTGEKPFLCTVCGRRFSDKSNMLRHLRGHTGEKPFQCRLCGKKFGNNSHMKRHLITHSGLKPHKCDVCGKGFRTSWYVKIHKANQHPEAK